MNRDQLGSLSEHEAGESDDMQAGERSGQALVVLDQVPAAAGPSEGPFHHPTSGQQDEALLGFGQLDDLQRNAVRAGGGGCSRADVETVGKWAKPLFARAYAA